MEQLAKVRCSWNKEVDASSFILLTRYKEEENRLNWMHCQNRHQEGNTFGNFQICAQMF